MSTIIRSLLIVVAVAAIAGGATYSYFSDTETSNANTFTAGTLDLKLNGADAPVTVFNVTNMRPGNQPLGQVKLKNAGSIAGNLSISGVILTSEENGLTEPEEEAGDVTSGINEGELQNRLGFTLFQDNDCNGWVGVGEPKLYDGMMKDLPSTIAISKTLAANEEICLSYQVNWWDSGDAIKDNVAQSDGVKIDMTFGIKQ